MKITITQTLGEGGLPPHFLAEATVPDREDTRTVQGEGVSEIIALGKLVKNNSDFLGITIKQEHR